MASTSFISDKYHDTQSPNEYGKDYFRYENAFAPNLRNIVREFRNDCFIDVYSHLISIVITGVSKYTTPKLSVFILQPNNSL